MVKEDQPMKTWLSRFLVSLSVALFLLGTAANVEAQIGPKITTTADGNPDCRECHWPVYIAWEQSSHGQGLSCGQCHLGEQDNHAREGHWTQGGPQECMSCHTTGYDPETDSWEEGSIHCKACHSPINPEHPEEPMPTDRTAELCGTCHIEAHFEWRVSAHGQSDVACVSCHSQHTTSLKAATVTEQCATCHEILAAGFAHSAHDEEGLSCADCHLATFEGPITEGRAKRNHTFAVALDTCTACHGAQMHDGMEKADAARLIQVRAEPMDAMSSSINAAVTDTPKAANPYGYIIAGGITAGLGIGGVGLGMVIVVGPRLSLWINGIRSKRKRGDSNE
jgi:hypothetical protein